MSIDIRIPVRLRSIATLMALTAAPVCVTAQVARPDTASTASSLFSRTDAVVAAAFVVGTAAMMPLDRQIAQQSQRKSLQGSAALRHSMSTVSFAGQPGAIVLAGATYLYGRSASSPRAAQLGLRTIEAIGAASVVGLALKGVAGRARPYVVGDTNPHNFKFGRGFGSERYSSFPSGHVTTAFAAATTVSQEIAELWPDASHVWTPVLYTTASLVGVARIYENKHWASDVVAGAAVGTLVSRVVVKYSRSHPRNAIDRLLLPVGVSQINGASGATFVWNLQF